MTLKEHYSINSRKSIKPYFKLIIMFFILITVSHTYARYTYTTTNNGVISVAKWYIEINGTEITNATSNLNNNIRLLNVEDNTTNIDSGDECYFDIIINPSTTEVAISYSILVDLAESNLPSGTKILKYEKYVNTGANEELDGPENIINAEMVSITENVTLPETQIALNNELVRRYRIFCKIPFPTDIDKDEDFTVTPTITVKQYINQQ